MFSQSLFSNFDVEVSCSMRLIKGLADKEIKHDKGHILVHSKNPVDNM